MMGFARQRRVRLWRKGYSKKANCFAFLETRVSEEARGLSERRAERWGRKNPIVCSRWDLKPGAMCEFERSERRAPRGGVAQNFRQEIYA